jgi:ribosomal protein S8
MWRYDMNEKVRTAIFPCKSISVMNFLKNKGFHSEYKITDAKDNREVWIFLRTDALHAALDEYALNNPKKK